MPSYFVAWIILHVVNNHYLHGRCLKCCTGLRNRTRRRIPCLHSSPCTSTMYRNGEAYICNLLLHICGTNNNLYTWNSDIQKCIMCVCTEDRIVYQTKSVCESLLTDDTILEPSLTRQCYTYMRMPIQAYHYIHEL